jgi:hypothetical protein
VPSASGACVRTASISCRFDGFTSAWPATTTVGTVSFPAATDRTWIDVHPDYTTRTGVTPILAALDELDGEPARR